MSQVTVALPDSVSEAEAKLQLAVRLFQVGSLSCGQAAELAGFSKRTFIELLGKQGVAVLDYSADELMHCNSAFADGGAEIGVVDDGEI